jgi:outer membrane autotransporter protein
MSDFLGFLINADAQPPQQTASADLGGMTVVPAADVASSSGWSMWGKAFGGTASLPGDDEAGSSGTDTDLFGFATGWDHALSGDATLGFAIAGGGTRWDLDDSLGSGESTFLQLGAHGTQRFGASYLSLAGAYAWHWMETERRALSDTLTAEFTASTIGGRIEAGHRFAAQDDLGLTPYAALQAQAAFLPDYREDGSAAALAFDEKTASAIRSELGLKLDLTADALRLTAGLAWAHDWESDANVDASFLSLPGTSFTVNGAEAPDDLALVTAGAAFDIAAQTILSARFDGEFGKDYQSYGGSLALSYNW